MLGGHARRVPPAGPRLRQHRLRLQVRRLGILGQALKTTRSLINIPKSLILEVVRNFCRMFNLMT